MQYFTFLALVMRIIIAALLESLFCALAVPGVKTEMINMVHSQAVHSHILPKGGSMTFGHNNSTIFGQKTQ